jgi:hypothetical protein
LNFGTPLSELSDQVKTLIRSYAAGNTEDYPQSIVILIFLHGQIPNQETEHNIRLGKQSTPVANSFKAFSLISLCFHKNISSKRVLLEPSPDK